MTDKLKPPTTKELAMWERSSLAHVKHALAPGIICIDSDGREGPGHIDGEEVLRLIAEVRWLRGALPMTTAPGRVDMLLQDADTAASWLGVSPRTLERWRVQGCGPTFVKMGKRAFYLEADLREYVDSCRRQSTSGARRRHA